MLIVHALSGLYVGVGYLSSVFVDDGKTKAGFRIGSLCSLWSMLRWLLCLNSSWRLTCALVEGVSFDLWTHDRNLLLAETSSGGDDEIIPRCRLITFWLTTRAGRWLLFSGVVITLFSVSTRSQHFHFMDRKRSANPLRNRLENILYRKGLMAEFRR